MDRNIVEPSALFLTFAVAAGLAMLAGPSLGWSPRRWGITALVLLLSPFVVAPLVVVTLMGDRLRTGYPPETMASLGWFVTVIMWGLALGCYVAGRGESRRLAASTPPPPRPSGAPAGPGSAAGRPGAARHRAQLLNPPGGSSSSTPAAGPSPTSPAPSPPAGGPPLAARPLPPNRRP